MQMFVGRSKVGGFGKPRKAHWGRSRVNKGEDYDIRSQIK